MAVDQDPATLIRHQTKERSNPESDSSGAADSVVPVVDEAELAKLMNSAVQVGYVVLNVRDGAANTRTWEFMRMH